MVIVHVIINKTVTSEAPGPFSIPAAKRICGVGQ